ncbi:SLU7 [[Candida] subhashii]|uniref:Pre-mRNA-splicing factor SLU7 n=1 Tax=[Candida] subhashii TaxID=561895 RepID=A0A8J5QSR8_9ASCO|nr:SLU7 [[Candida] subhashii]KAG7665723.1 SLU7 [[Candida] subhashii]
MSKAPNKEINPYIPKYITSKPWYQDAQQTKTKHEEEGDNNGQSDDYLSHHRKQPKEIVDYSQAKIGSGIQDNFEGSIRKDVTGDNYDMKRDRWYGYSSEEWLDQIKKWEESHQQQQKTKRRKVDKNKNGDEDSDDTDYELELIELGLEKKDIFSNIKEDPMEKMLRDRQDIPSYIYNITSNENNKIRLEYDPKSRITKDPSKGFLNDQNQFIKRREGDAKDLTNLQKLAWELDQQDKKKSLAILKEQEIEAENIPETDLKYSLEASPTLMMLKAKQAKEEQLRRSALKRQELLNKYGSASSASKDSTDITPPIHAQQYQSDQNSESISDPTLDKNGLRKSRYVEDQIGLDHTTIYGSFYKNGKWGYSCCKQLAKNSYCTNSKP